MLKSCIISRKCFRFAGGFMEHTMLCFNILTGLVTELFKVLRQFVRKGAVDLRLETSLSEKVLTFFSD